MKNNNTPQLQESRCHLVPTTTSPKATTAYNPLSALCHGYVDPSFDPMNMVAKMEALEAERRAKHDPFAREIIGEPVTSAGVKTHSRALFEGCEPKEIVQPVETVEIKEYVQPFEPITISEKQPRVDVVVPNASLHETKASSARRTAALITPLIFLTGAGYSFHAFLGEINLNATDLHEMVMSSFAAPYLFLFAVFVLGFFYAALNGLASKTSPALIEHHDEKLGALSV